MSLSGGLTAIIILLHIVACRVKLKLGRKQGGRLEINAPSFVNADFCVVTTDVKRSLVFVCTRDERLDTWWRCK